MNELECTFSMPDIGEGLVSAEIIEWLVKVGDVVEADQPALVIETVKSTVELPMPFGGTVLELYGQARDVIPVGAPLITLLTREHVPAGADNVTHLVGRRHNPAGQASGAPAQQLRRLPPKSTAMRVVAAPAVRRLARDLAVELDKIVGTGKGGAITVEDVQAAAADAVAAP